MCEALMRFGDLNREAGDEVEDVEVEASLIMGAVGIDSDRGLITVINAGVSHGAMLTLVSRIDT